MINGTEPPAFIPGLKLAEGFFSEEVKPILESHFTGLQYSAALIGSGSEVLGFDTEMSSDHHWGPRVMLFLKPENFSVMKDNIKFALSKQLLPKFRGYSTSFSEPDPADHGTQLLKPAVSGAINHRVEVFTIPGFFLGYLNIDINKEMSPADWLTLPQQKLRSLVSGRVFHDELGLERIRGQFAWYPHDVWLYILASGWARIGQEEHLMGRAGFVNDEIGSSLIGARLVRDIMRLAFLMEKQYPPYAKWFGTAFSKLKSSERLAPVLTHVLHSYSWQDRETHLCQAYHLLAEMHNNLKITGPLSSETYQFFGRPFQIIGGEKFAKAIAGHINDPDLARLAKQRSIGSIDIFSDNTDLLEDESVRPAIKLLYQ